MHNTVEEGHGKQKDDAADEVYHVKQYSNISDRDHGKQAERCHGRAVRVPFFLEQFLAFEATMTSSDTPRISP